MGWPIAAAPVLLVVGVVLVAVAERTGVFAIGVVSLIGGLGISWKGIIGSLGTVVAELQEPVWGAALDEQISASIAKLPNGADPAGIPSMEAAPTPGPQPELLPASE